MRKFTKILALVFSAVMLLSIMSVSAFAADSADYNESPAGAKTYFAAFLEAGLDMDAVRNSETKEAVAGTDYSLTKDPDNFPQRFAIMIDGQKKDVYVAAKYVDACKTITNKQLMNDNGQMITLGPNETNTTGVWNNLFGSVQGIITGLSGLLTLAFTVLFMIQLFKLGSSAGNPTQRQQALTGLLWTGIAFAAFGAITVIMSFFQSAI